MTLSRRRLLRQSLAAFPALALTGACTPRAGDVGIERLAPALDALLPTRPDIFVVGEGYVWAEGPAWDRVRNCLYFTDVPGNRTWRWRAGEGVRVWLDPSGIDPAEADGFREPGMNGLWMRDEGTLLACVHGTRSVVVIDPDTRERRTLCDRYGGSRFNSPNDLVESADGTIYFTDPPYGLEGLDASPLKELDANGVYRRDAGGHVTRLLDDLRFPNGIALSPDERSLYISQSDPDRPIIRRLQLDGMGGFTDDRTLFDASALDGPGLPDGMAVDVNGHIFATGPGGVLILSPEGELLGRILAGRACANCAFGGPDGRMLYVAAHDRVLQIPTLTQGLQWA